MPARMIKIASTVNQLNCMGKSPSSEKWKNDRLIHPPCCLFNAYVFQWALAARNAASKVQAVGHKPATAFAV
jgi:hypothetical protein